MKGVKGFIAKLGLTAAGVSIMAAVAGVPYLGQGEAEGAASTSGEAAISGSNTVVTEQPLKWRTVTVEGATEASTAIAPEGTYFTSEARTFIGSKYTMNLGLENESQASTAVVMTVNYPQGFKVKASPSLTARNIQSIANIDPHRWMIALAPGTLAEGEYNLSLSVTVGMDTAPGDHRLSFSVAPLTE